MYYVQFWSWFIVKYILFFFFSSRRRHTRYIGDWSSDVCSSDLGHPAGERDVRQPHHRLRHDGGRTAHEPPGVGGVRCPRSEERRVGKECRSRWSTDHKKKK